MPELPEVETMCRGLRPVIGALINRVVDPKCTYRPVVCEPSMRSLAARLRGQAITGVSRIGKRVIIETQRWSLVLQPKMTGLVSIEEPPSREHVRLILELSGCEPESVTFWDRRGLGTILLIERDQVVSRLVTGKLGPDALVISCQEFTSRLSSTRRPIKVALLDQKIVAGIGNLYASEMLHAAGIDPCASSAAIDSRAYARLHAEMLIILNLAIQYEGSTLSDGTYRNALNQAGSYQNEHKVYDRAGQPCPTCGTGPIQRIVQAQRSTFFCATCQRP
ncbi:MAG: bifunctional DNA-formamidopyrimidine glycosylase/DNA-(apurinic or apyrimidinic site) lyase [Pirellulaceae bacterium]|nr:bifunctional DNA-formamidopyrimidine glycosylase/DNA-(apurinic or apyrimidinic site) lyase [Pirellulaceae bacterium]